MLILGSPNRTILALPSPSGSTYTADFFGERLADTTIKASTTIGFPHGGHTTSVKVAEAQRAVDDGCEELDMVVNISKVLSDDWSYVRDDVAAVIDVAHHAGQKIKVIFENCYLQNEHKILSSLANQGSERPFLISSSSSILLFRTMGS